MFNFWKRRSSEQDPQDNPFAAWPPIEEVDTSPQLPAIFRQGATKVPDALNSESHRPHPYPPLVIGLGKTGETVLREWQGQVVQSAGFGEGGAGILIHTGRETVGFSQSGPNIRTFHLQPSGDVQIVYGLDSRSARAYTRSLFGQAVYYEPFKNHLNKLVSKMRSIRVFIVGSLAEPIIGVFGSLLQVLADHQEHEPRPFHSIDALLTFDSPRGITPLSQEEMYAALREIGRFTWKGPHVMPPPAFNEKRRNYSSNLLDHLFLIETTPKKTGIHQPNKTTETAEHRLSEGLFLLSHRAGQEIWEHLINELAVSSRLRNLLNDSVVHSFGVASLVLPLPLLERYAVLRLVNAVLFGETDHPDGGLAEVAPTSDRGASLASKWLKYPPYQHEFFAWLLTIQHSQQLSHFPEVGDQHAAVFRKKMAAHITSFLNQPAGGNIIAVKEALQWLATHFENIETIAKSLPPTRLNAPRTQSFLRVIAQLKATCIHLAREVDEWLKVSYPKHVSSDYLGSSPAQHGEDVFASLREEFGNRGEASFGQTENSPTSSHDSSARIVWRDFIQSTLEGLYQKLEQAAHDASRRSVIGRENVRQELADFYRNVIRPELHQPNALIESPVFDPVRKRVGWWGVTSAEKEEPEIRAVCLPLSWNPGRNFPLQFSFTYAHSNDFFEAIQDLCLHQVRTTRQKMLDQFQFLALPRADFLSNAHRAFLEYDKNEVARIKGQTTSDHESEHLAVRRGYILAPNPALAQKYTSLFQDLPTGNVNPIGSMDSNRLSGLEITTFIPLHVVERYQTARENYPFKEVVHLYRQEQNAKLLEKKIRQYTTHKRIQLSPGITLSLYSYPLVRLFCRTLFAGLIFEASVQEGFQTFKVWQLTGLDDYPNINLAKAPDLASLENAFRAFTLEIPYHYENFGDPFHPDNRKVYLSALTRRIAQMAHTETTTTRMQRADSFLEPLLRAGRYNRRLLEFALILKVERETLFEPIPENIDWEKELWR